MTGAEITIEGDVAELPQIAISRGKPLSKGVRPCKDREAIIDALKMVFDPDVNIDVHSLGLIYGIEIASDGGVKIDMSLTSPTCPMAEEMVAGVADAVAGVEGVGVVDVRLVWTPPWSMSMLSDEAKCQLEIGDIELWNIT